VELATAEHNERRRISNDIHDHLAQLLVLSRMKLQLALKSPMDSAARASVSATDSMLAESLQYTLISWPSSVRRFFSRPGCRPH
jgi:signal transduction histidine kinase